MEEVRKKDLTDRAILGPYRKLLDEIKDQQEKVLNIDRGLAKINSGIVDECYIGLPEFPGYAVSIQVDLARPYFEQALAKETAELSLMIAKLDGIL